MFLNVSWKKFGFSSYTIWAGWYLTRSLNFEVNLKTLRLSAPPWSQAWVRYDGRARPAQPEKEMCLGTMWFLWLGIQNQLPREGLDSPPIWIWPWGGPLCRPGVCAPAVRLGFTAVDGRFATLPWTGPVHFCLFLCTREKFRVSTLFGVLVLATAPAGDHRVLLADFNAQWRWKLKGWLEGLPPWTELACGRKVE